MSLSDYTGKVNQEEVKILGVPFTLKEFDNRTRGLWVDIADQYNLPEMQRKIQTDVVPILSGYKSNVENDPRVKSISKRIEKLEKKHDALMEKYGDEDEPEDIDEQLTTLIEREEALVTEMYAMMESMQGEVLGKTQGVEGYITEFMEAQDEARMYFVWQLAKVRGATELEFEEWCAKANAEDYGAAEELVNLGNARWASLYGNRMQMDGPQKKKRIKN